MSEAGAEGDAAFDAEAVERGRWLFAQACDFMTAAVSVASLPPDDLPEIAFAGRSNVGKSSLVNALTGRKTLARTSRTPGRTQQIIFFNLGHRLHLADLPGYGYAKVSKTQVADWTKLIHRYLKGRPSLRRVLLLIDGRHGIKPIDREIMDELDVAAVVYQVVLTKTDKVPPKPLAAMVAATEKALAKRPAAHPRIAVTSANDGAGIADLRAELAALAEI